MYKLKHKFKMNRKQFLLRAMLCGVLLTFSLYAAASTRISLSTKNKSVREVIKVIEKTSDYRFFYNEDLPGLDTNVSIEVKQGTINTVMDQLAAQVDIAFLIRDNNQIVLSAKAADPEQVGRRITGTVVDEKSEPIIGANVVEKGTTNGMSTDVNGNFNLEVADNAVLQISFIGYITQEISVPLADTGGQKADNHIIGRCAGFRGSSRNRLWYAAQRRSSQRHHQREVGKLYQSAVARRIQDDSRTGCRTCGSFARRQSAFHFADHAARYHDAESQRQPACTH
jgi:hypothetical protein